MFNYENGSIVKKVIIFILLAVFVASFSFASNFNLNVGLGIPSEIGISFLVERFEFGVKVNTSYLTGGLVSYSFMDKIVSTNLSNAEKFEYGNKLIHGLTVDSYFKTLDFGIFELSLGLSIFGFHISSKEGVISHFTKANLVFFNLNTKLGFKIGQKSSIYLNTGFPLFSYINYGGEENNYNYSGFDFWAFIPKAIKEVEDGGWVGDVSGKLVLLLLAMNLRMGVSYHF